MYVHRAEETRNVCSETAGICHKDSDRNRRAAEKTWVYAHRLASDTGYNVPGHISRPDENAEEIVSRHIKLLHRYNEAKDATQV